MTVEALTSHPHGAVTATKRLLQDAPARTIEEQRLAERTAQVARFRALGAACAPAPAD